METSTTSTPSDDPPVSAERQAVEQLRHLGDARAFESLYSAYADRLYRFVLRLAGDDRDLVDEDVEELIADSPHVARGGTISVREIVRAETLDGR